jgi:hypothetical protein
MGVNGISRPSEHPTEEFYAPIWSKMKCLTYFLNQGVLPVSYWQYARVGRRCLMDHVWPWFRSLFQ